MIIAIGPLTLPKRQIDILRRPWRDEDIIVGDVANGPTLGAKCERLSFGGLPDEFFVQLADHGVGLGVAHAEQSTIGYRAARHIEVLHGPLAHFHRAIAVGRR